MHPDPFLEVDSKSAGQEVPVLYEGVSERFRTESIMKYTLNVFITRWEATQRVMDAKLTRL